MPAVESARTDIVVVADADVWCDGLPEAAEAVRDGAAWAVPHRLVHRLTETATRSLIAGGSPDEYEQRPYPGVEGGGVIVTRRDTLLEIPLDPRFVGWGQEDVSHGVALRTLLGGCWRGTADLIHLWHPPQERLSRKVGSLQGRALGRRYFDARRSPDEMRALLAEVL